MINLDESAPGSCPFEQIIDAIRAELQEYGSLLNLFDEQEAAILDLKRDLLRKIGREIEAQLTTLGARGSARSGLISALDLPRAARASLRQIIPLFPQPMRPLVEALASELNSLADRVRRRTGQIQKLEERMFDSRSSRTNREFAN